MTFDELCERCGGSGKEPDFKAIGKAMKAKRDEAGITLEKLGRLMKITTSYLCDMEHGRRDYTAARIKQFEKALEKLKPQKGEQQ